MRTRLERRGEKRIAPCGKNDKVYRGPNDNAHFGRNENVDLWAPTCATAGAAVWAGTAVLARMGIARLGGIELLFLFAPLVIAPLGMELGRVLGASGRLEEIARRLHLQPCTAKKHVRNILGKLNVHRRGQAVAKLRSLIGEQFAAAE